MFGKIGSLFWIFLIAEEIVVCQENSKEKNLGTANNIDHANRNEIKRYLIKTAPLSDIRYHYRTNHMPSKFLGTIIRAAPPIVSDNIVESQSLVIHESSQIVKPPEKANVIDWFLGVVGARPTESSSGSSSTASTPSKNCVPCSCGQTYTNKRIVGGVETMVNEYPWMTALLYQNRFYCGASLINNKYILTAAHCVNGFSRERMTAVFLDHDRSNSFETKTITRKIKNIYRHRSYGTGGNYNNDIAILQLEQEVPLDGLLKPVCLPPTGKSFTGYNGIATGWGAVKEHGQVSNKLREVTVPIMSNIDCRKSGYENRITENMLCAGYDKGMKDSCQGDSGGPLHVVNGTIHQIVGIVSWGEGCAQANYPGVYTRVNRYISWIKSNTRDACYC